MNPEDPVVSYGVGEQVQAEFDGEGWLTGTVTRVFGDGTLEVTFEDGYVDRFSAATTTDELRRPRESEDGDAWPESSSSAGNTFSHRITLQRKVAEGAISPLERDWIAQIEAQLEADSVLEQKVGSCDFNCWRFSDQCVCSRFTGLRQLKSRWPLGRGQRHLTVRARAHSKSFCGCNSGCVFGSLRRCASGWCKKVAGYAP